MNIEKNPLISLKEASKSTPYSSDYIGLLVRKGKLKSEKIGGKWFTTRSAVDNYIKKAAKASFEHQEYLNVKVPEAEVKKARVNFRWALVIVSIAFLFGILYWKIQDDQKNENIRLKYKITEDNGNLYLWADDPGSIKSVKVMKKE